jgi:hypothetical protein
MVREKMLVVRGEIWTLFAIFMLIILFHYIIILFQTSSNKYHTNNFVIIKQEHFILIKLNFYDHYFTDVCTFKKIILVVRGIQNCEFSGPWGPNGWRSLLQTSLWQAHGSNLGWPILARGLCGSSIFVETPAIVTGKRYSCQAPRHYDLWGMDGGIVVHINLGSRLRWGGSFTHTGRSTPGERNTGTQWKLGGPQRSEKSLSCQRRHRAQSP